MVSQLTVSEPSGKSISVDAALFPWAESEEITVSSFAVFEVLCHYVWQGYMIVSPTMRVDEMARCPRCNRMEKTFSEEDLRWFVPQGRIGAYGVSGGMLFVEDLFVSEDCSVCAVADGNDVPDDIKGRVFVHMLGAYTNRSIEECLAGLQALRSQEQLCCSTLSGAGTQAMGVFVSGTVCLASKTDVASVATLQDGKRYYFKDRYTPATGYDDLNTLKKGYHNEVILSDIRIQGVLIKDEALLPIASEFAQKLGVALLEDYA
jgi:hypothetical protein